MLLQTFALSNFEWSHDRRLLPSDEIRDNDVVVLRRQPLPRALFVYVPLRFAAIVDADADVEPVVVDDVVDLDVDEETLISRAMSANPFLNVQQTRRGAARPLRQDQHASDFPLNANGDPQPHDGYVCATCDARGHHFRVDCRAGGGNDDDDGGGGATALRATKKARTAYGIPKTFLVAAPESGTTSDGGGSLLKTAQGELVHDARVSHAQTFAAAVAEVAIPILPPLAADAVLPPPSFSSGDPAAPPAASVLLQLGLSVEFTKTIHRGRPRSNRKRAPLHDDTGEDTVVVVEFDFEAHLTHRDAAEDDVRRRTALPATHKLQSMCTHWLRGLCSKGWACEYQHVFNSASMPICKFFLHSVCSNGDECAFKHVLPPSASRRGLRPCCPAYALGFCAAGAAACSFQHIKREEPCRGDFVDFPKGEGAFDVFVRLWESFFGIKKDVQ
jgi:cleavage and polyadenylation specificity factor subunit 4